MTGATTVVVGHDMRPSSPGLAGAFATGATEAGADVVMIGLASTDQLYFASGHLGLPGAMFTASHNPAQYNGIKLCRANAVPLGMETGLAEIRDLVIGAAPDRRADRRGPHRRPARGLRRAPALARPGDRRPPAEGRRRRRQRHGRPHRARGLRPAPRGARSSWCRCTSSSTAPSPTTRPTRSSRPTSATSRRASSREGADIGLAFDGDADRCFVVDERGAAVSPSTLTALIASRELAKEPGATVIHNLITSRAVPELVRELGGVPVRTRVGHSYIKATMAETDAIFGGEHSGHFYFRDFWRADSGMLAALHTLAALSETDRPLSELLADFDRYPLSGEINSEVADPAAVTEAVAATYAGQDGVTLDRLDGLTVSHADWTFNVRPSNTEPLLRLNVEGRDRETMERVRDDVLALIRKETPMPLNLSAALLAIIVCPDCHGDLAPVETADGGELVCQALRPGLPGPRRHPGAAGRRGPPARLSGTRWPPGSTSPGSTTSPRWRRTTSGCGRWPSPARGSAARPARPRPRSPRPWPGPRAAAGRGP